MGDGTLQNPLADADLQDELIDAKLKTFSYQEALAQCAEVRYAVVSANPSKYKSGSTDVESDFENILKALEHTIDVARRDAISSPNPQDSRPQGVMTALTSPDMCGLRTD